jgi:ABC-type lipoprotein export system ATPase subunit
MPIANPIEIKGLLPLPLKDKLIHAASDIWNSSQAFLSGEWVKVKASSGKGKTTLIHILYNLRSDYEGAVFWYGKNILHLSSEQQAKQRQEKASIIFQDLRLFTNLTARENIELNRVLQQPYYQSGVIDEMAGQLGVMHILDQRAGLCSYGEQQRIAIIRALVQPFDFLLMDEPFSHLDKENTSIAASLIAAECRKRNAGFILTDLDDDDHFDYTRKLNL